MNWRYRLGLAAITLCAALAIPVRFAAQQPESRHLHYKLIELGTLGGPTSYINPVGNGGPYINRRGAVVGSSMTSVPLLPDNNGFPCVGSPPVFPDVFHGMEWSEDGGVSDLPSLGRPSNCANVMAINDNDESFGTSENGKIDPLLGARETRAVLWKDGQVRNLGTFGGNQSVANSINNRRQVVGFVLNTLLYLLTEDYSS
jgi:hypothetical protein